MISVLSLIVAILAVFFGPLVAIANVQRQIRATAREAWMREFRERVSQFRTSVMLRARAEGGTAAEAEEIRSATLSFHVTKLLIAEKAPQYDEFERLINRLLAATGRAGERAPPELVNEFGNTAASILRRERGLIEAKQRMIIPGFGAFGWPSWARFVAWCRRDPPHFRDDPDQ
jgi:hypothetical protein